MKKIKFVSLLVIVSATLAAQPANDKPCGAHILIPAYDLCQPFEDNNSNSQTSLVNATVTTGSGVYDFNCYGEPTNNLNDVWFKIPLSDANLVIKAMPIAGMDVEFQVYYRQSGQCEDNNFMMEILACSTLDGVGLPDSVNIPSYYSTYYDTLYIRVYNYPDGPGPSPVNNSQFSICAYYPAPACTINTFPADAAMLFEGVSLSWAYSQNASSYDVYLGNSVATAQFIGNTVSTDFDITGLNLLPGIYYWYVIPKNGTVAGTGCASSATLFTILETAPNNKRCNAFLLTASDLACNPYSDPSTNSSTSYNRATYTNDIFGGGANCTLNSFLDADVWFKFIAPDSAFYVFRVEPVTGINTSFRVFESTADCSGTLTNKGCYNTGNIAIADTGLILLRPGKEYFIQVFSQNGSRDFNPPGNSQFGICIYKPIPSCISPLLVSPADGAVNVDHITGSLSWKEVPGASRYNLYAGTSLATLQLVNYTVLQNSGGNKILNFQTNFSNGSPFSPGVQYFWKVIPSNDDIINTTCTEEIRTFTTSSCPASLFLLNPIVKGTHAGELDATVTCPNCDASWFVFEYGTDSSPGTGTTAAAGNTVIYPVPQTPAGYHAAIAVDSTFMISTLYYHYRVIGCLGSSGTYLPLDPGSPTVVTTCSSTPIVLFDGKGRWNFNGAYPANSNGKATPGKMSWFNFTPTENGVYYLQVDSVEVYDSINYLYKPDSLNKYSPDNWTGIGAINKKGKYAIGYLTAGVVYRFVADSENDSLLNKVNTLPGLKHHFIRICKAPVLAPLVINDCIDATVYNPVPALSPKEEFAIDTSGRLVASIKAGNDSLGVVNVSYYVNGNGLRYDANGREYLDRNYIITPSLPVASIQQVKLYFTADELTALINAPDDGNADVSSINDLVVTKTNQTCQNSAQVTNSGNILIVPTERTAFDATSGYVKLPVSSFSTFYLHGGSNFILPLSLLSFTGSKENHNALLRWSTANEINVSRFELQRSDDGQNFLTIATVQPGNVSYMYADINIFNNRSIVFYRLKSIDIDDKFAYSSVIKLTGQYQELITIYPNPVTDKLVIGNLKQKGVVRLFNVQGELLVCQAVNAQTITMDMSKYIKGIYMLQYQLEQQIINQKIIKL